MRRCLSAVVCVAALSAAAAPSLAVLGEFGNADGYANPFSTRVWTYNPLWTFEGGAIGSNYVAQHGYGSGFAMNDPFALVVRNDIPASNFQFNYQFEPVDLGGANPANVAGTKIEIGFDVSGFWGSNATVTAPMLTMGFGGTRANPAMRIGFSNNSRLMYSDTSNNLIESSFTISGNWSRVQLNLDYNTFTYDLLLHQLTGNPNDASNTYTIVNTFSVISGAPMANNTTDLSRFWWAALTNTDGSGFGKSMYDHFTGTAVPAPGTLALLGAGILAGARRRRR